MPTYQVYTITYFTANPSEARRQIQATRPSADDSAESYSSPLDFPNILRKHPEYADLRYWASQEKLYWLDLENENLPLRTGKASFPYGTITGFGDSYVYYDPPLKVPKWMFWKYHQIRANGHIKLTIDQPWHPVMKKP